MSTALSEATQKPTKRQQFAFHAVNGIVGVAFLGVWNAKSVTGVMVGLVVGVVLIVIGHRLKKRGMQQAGEERMRVGRVAPVPPEGKNAFYVLGLFFFVLLALSMLIIPDFRQLVRIGMFLMCAGLAGSFAALIKPSLRTVALAGFGLGMLAGGGLIAADAVARFQEGGEDAILQTAKTGILAAVLLPAGLAVTWGMLRGDRHGQTPLFDNGMYTQWGFMPWSVLTVSLIEADGRRCLNAVGPNGWAFRMLVGDDQVEAVRTLIADAGSGKAPEVTSESA